MWLNGWSKSKVRDFTMRRFREIWTELAELGNTTSNNRRQKFAHTRLHALDGARDPERWTKGQKAEWFAVVDFVLQTVSQNATKLTRSAFVVAYRLTAPKDKRMKTVLLLKARQRCPRLRRAATSSQRKRPAPIGLDNGASSIPISKPLGITEGDGGKVRVISF